MTFPFFRSISLYISHSLSSISLFLYLSIYLSIYLCFSLFIYIFIHLSVIRSIHLSVPIYPCVNSILYFNLFLTSFSFSFVLFLFLSVSLGACPSLACFRWRAFPSKVNAGKRNYPCHIYMEEFSDRNFFFHLF